MSFDLTLWCRPGHLPDRAGLHQWVSADDRFTSVGELRLRGFGALTTCGGRPYASMDVEDVADLDEDDFGTGPDGYRPAGIRFEISYSTPDLVTGQIIRLVGEVAEQFGCVIKDEQFPSEIEEIARGWLEAAAQAREIFARHQQQHPDS